MITKDMTRDLIGRQAVDTDGNKVGKIGQVYLDERSETPTWATVNTGMFGTKESFVPLQGANLDDGDVSLAVAKNEVKDCPHVGRSDERLTGSEEDQLRHHYGTHGAEGGQEIGQDLQAVEQEMRDLVAEMADHRAVLLAQLQLAFQADQLVRLGHVDGDLAVGVAHGDLLVGSSMTSRFDGLAISLASSRRAFSPPDRLRTGARA